MAKNKKIWIKYLFFFWLGVFVSELVNSVSNNDSIPARKLDGKVELKNATTRHITRRPLNDESSLTTTSDNVEQMTIDLDQLKKEPILKQLEKQQFTVGTNTASISTRQSGFDQIVSIAQDIAIIEQMPAEPRKDFDIDFWENESGLKTGGGLNWQDRMLLGRLYRNASSVFEYGLGESTTIADYVGVPRFSGIDSDPMYIATTRDKVSNHFRFYLGDIGPTSDWGFPTNPQLDKFILDYQLLPLIVEPKPFDVYMVDGRWRLPCMLASFLHASARGASKEDTTVLIHDCQLGNTQGRKQYKRADHLLRMVSHSGNALCVYKRKKETTDAQLRETWEQYMNENLRRRR